MMDRMIGLLIATIFGSAVAGMTYFIGRHWSIAESNIDPATTISAYITILMSIGLICMFSTVIAGSFKMIFKHG